MGDEISSRADMLAPPPPAPNGSLPPAAKTAREVARGAKELGIPALLLLAAKWEIPHAGEAFIVACLIVLVGHIALRKAEGAPDWEAVITALLKR